MNTGDVILNTQALHNPAHPVHRIADQIEPYLRVLMEESEEFRPEQIILFGSYAYGTPNAASDIDLLVVKPIERSALQDALAIRRRWRELRKRLPYIPIGLLIESPSRHQERLARKGAFYSEINERGIALI
jgi:predicted nucleotidyltransferase